MQTKIESVHLGGVVVLVPEVFKDDRGFFMETFRSDQFKAFGLPGRFDQDNHSGSTRGVLRGLHFQWDPPMGKLMRVTRGSVFLVAVDIRKGSPTVGQWFGTEVSAENRRQMWAPAGFARGFCILSDYAEVQYKCDALYNKPADSGIRWDDPAIGIKWPVENAMISERDRHAPTLEQWLSSPQSEYLKYDPARDLVLV
jgi:dTDP-4-dehydrorhamnose 3,5-epimerase